MAGVEYDFRAESIVKQGGDGTHISVGKVTLQSATAQTFASRILDYGDGGVQWSFITNAGGADFVVWSAGSNDGEIDFQASGSDGIVEISVTVTGKGTC